MKGTTMNRERFGYMVLGGLLVLAGFVVGSLSQPNQAYAAPPGSGGACGAVYGVPLGSSQAAFVVVLPNGTVSKGTFNSGTGWNW